MKNAGKILGCIYSSVTAVAIMGFIYKDAIVESWERGDGVLASFVMRLSDDSADADADIEQDLEASNGPLIDGTEDSANLDWQDGEAGQAADAFVSENKNAEETSQDEHRDVCSGTEFLLENGPFPEKSFLVSECARPQGFLRPGEEEVISCRAYEQKREETLLRLRRESLAAAAPLCRTAAVTAYEVQNRIVLEPGDAVAFIGDGELSDAARIAAKDARGTKILDYGRMGIGILRAENGYITEKGVASASRGVKAVVIMAGRNDAQSLLDKKPWIVFGKPEWDAHYRARIVSVIEAAKEKNASVVWVLLPKTGDQAAKYKASLLNELFRSEAEKAGAIVVDPNKNVKGERRSSSDVATYETAEIIREAFIWPDKDAVQAKVHDRKALATSADKGRDSVQERRRSIERLPIDGAIFVRPGDRILFAGDETLEEMRDELQKGLEGLGAEAEFWTRSCTGYWPRGGSGWQDSLGEYLSKDRGLTHVALFLGTHDRYAYEQNDDFARYGSVKWRELYLQKLDEIIEIAGRSGLKVILAGSPKVRGKPSSLPVNETIRTAAIRAGAAYVDLSNGPEAAVFALLERMMVQKLLGENDYSEVLAVRGHSGSKEGRSEHSEPAMRKDAAVRSSSMNRVAISPRAGCRVGAACLFAGDRVLLVGDSMMQGTAPPLMKILKGMGLQSSNPSKQSTGLLTRNGTDWSIETRKHLEADSSIRLVIVMLGANDPWAMPISGGRHAKFGSDEWKKLYRARADALYAAAKEHGAGVIWIEVPRVRNAKLDEGIAVINAVLREAARANRGYWISTDFLSDENGEFSMYAVLDGKKVKARADDGVHFTRSGSTAIAEAAAKRIAVKSQENGE